MSILGKIEGLRATVKSGLASRLLAALLGGSLNQKVIIVLGLAIMVGALYSCLMELWQPLLIGIVGGVFVHLAMRDYERTSGTGTSGTGV